MHFSVPTKKNPGLSGFFRKFPYGKFLRNFKRQNFSGKNFFRPGFFERAYQELPRDPLFLITNAWKQDST
jgi:hypothetical protein